MGNWRDYGTTLIFSLVITPMDYFKHATRNSYLTSQLKASTEKFSYCKVSYTDAVKYVTLTNADKSSRKELPEFGPILCLGVRNGREVDLFRIANSGRYWQQMLTGLLEVMRHGYASYAPIVERWGRGTLDLRTPTSCVGVELNPIVQRSDVLVKSFDDLPVEWQGQFGFVYSNAFDHVFDPFETAKAWRKMIRPGGYLLLAVSAHQKGTELEPCSALILQDVLELFPGEIVYSHKNGSARGYTEYLIHFP